MTISTPYQLLGRAVLVLSLLTVSACATDLTEDERLMHEYTRVERVESIKAYVAACEQAGNTIVYSGPSRQKLRDPVKYVPGHAREKDYVCVSTTTVNREFGTGG